MNSNLNLLHDLTKLQGVSSKCRTRKTTRKTIVSRTNLIYIRSHLKARGLLEISKTTRMVKNLIPVAHPPSSLKMGKQFSYRRSLAWKRTKTFLINSRKYFNSLFISQFRLRRRGLGLCKHIWKVCTLTDSSIDLISIRSSKEEEYFSVPLQVTRRKLLGLRDSLVASSVWRPEFKESLERYPNFELVELDFAVPSCDACHLGGRMSTLIGRLSGEAYNRTGFGVVSRTTPYIIYRIITLRLF